MNKIYDNVYTVNERKELIAYVLKNLRLSKKYTQQYVANEIGINVQTYATYERGRNEPPAEIIVRLSYLYDMPIDFIMQRDNVEKSTIAIKNQLEEFDNVLEDMRTKILSGDPKMREEIKNLADALGGLTDWLKEIKGISTEENE